MKAQTLPPPITVTASEILWHLDVIRNNDMVAIIIYDQYSNQAFIRILPQYDYFPLVMQNFVLMTTLNHLKPHKIISDNDTQFSSKGFKRFLKGNRIEHVNYSPFQSEKGKFEWILKTLEPLLQAAKKEVTLKVNVSKGQAGIVDECKDPFREALLSLHMQIQADIDSRSLYNAQSSYASSLLCKIEDMCQAIDPELFQKEES